MEIGGACHHGISEFPLSLNVHAYSVLFTVSVEVLFLPQDPFNLSFEDHFEQKYLSLVQALDPTLN